MKFAWSSVLCLLVIHAADAFKDLFKHHSDDKPGLLDILTKPKLPAINVHLGSHLGGGSFGFGFGFGGQYQPPGVNLPPRETVHVKPDYPGVTGDEKKKVGPRPNWGEGKDDYDDGKEGYPKPGSYDDDKEGYPKPGSYDDDKEDPKPEKKDSFPDWEDIGEKHPKSENMKDEDFFGDGLIQPRFNRRRSKRYIESRVYHVPLLFRSNAKPYQVKIRSHPNSLTKD